MPAQTVSGNFLVGSVAASATTGALIAVGRRIGSASLPFAAIGALPFHRTPSALDVRFVAAGLVLEVVTTFAWTAVFGWLVRVVRREVVAASTVAIAQLAVSWITAWSTGTGLASVLALGDRIVVAVVLAGALVVGTRLARSSARRNQPATSLYRARDDAEHM